MYYLLQRKIEVYIFCFFIFSIASCQNTQNEQEANVIEEEVDPVSGGDFVRIFDGESLAGWDGDNTYWRVESGSIVGEITPENLLQANTFLTWQGGIPSDFELKVDFKISEGGNSGVNYRSDQLEEIPYALKGYQADIDGKNTYTGQNYEERKRTTLAYRGQKTSIKPQRPPGEMRDFIENNAWKGLTVTEELGDRDSLKTLIKAEDWNTLHLVIKGNVFQHFVNGVLMSEVHDEDVVNRNSNGLIGVQVHVGPPMKVEFRNFLLKEL